MKAFLSWLEKVLIGIFILIFGILAVILVNRHYRQAEEEADPWNRARKANTIESYLGYLKVCDPCSHATQAAKTLEELQRARGLLAVLATGHLSERSSISLPAFSPDGRVILASSGQGPEFWDVESGKFLARSEKDFPMRGRRAAALDVSPDGRRIAAGTAGTEGGSLFMWDETSGVAIGEHIVEDYDVKAVRFAPNSRLLGWLAVGPVGVWDPAAGQFLRGTHEGASDLAFVATEPGRSQLVTASGRELWFWEPSTMEVVRQARLNTDRTLLGLSRDGTAAVYSDGTVLEVWNTLTGNQVGALRDLASEIVSFCREPRKGWLAVGTKTGILYLWDPAGSALPLAQVAAHEGPVEQLACSGQGRLVTVGWNSAKVWNIDRLVKSQGLVEAR